MIKIQRLWLVAAFIMCCGATEVKAAEIETENYQLEVPEMKPEMVMAPALTFLTIVIPPSDRLKVYSVGN